MVEVNVYLDKLIEMVRGKLSEAHDLFEHGALKGFDPLRTLRFVQDRERQGVERTDLLTPQQKQIIRDRYPIYEAYRKANNILKESGEYNRLREIAYELNSAKTIDKYALKNFGKKLGGRKAHFLRALSGLKKGNIVTLGYFNSLKSFANYVEISNRKNLIKEIEMIQEKYYSLIKSELRCISG